MSIRRIAKLTGLSPTAVSMALRNSPKIPEATRQRALRAAKQIGYKPNARFREAMTRLRWSGDLKTQACFGVMSFYEEARPWEKSAHLRRIYEAMSRRATALGYRLEPLWLRAPGMTYARFCSILDARGIEGLLCFGSPKLDEEFPAEFDHYAIVTQGLSIRTPLHRVVSHVYNDMWRALDRLYRLGYRRPGLVMGRYEDARSAHAYLCVYLGWTRLVLPGEPEIPVLDLDRVEEKVLLPWLDRHRPDVIVFVHHYNELADFAAILRRRMRVPRDIGVAVISQILERTGFSGLQENQSAIGAWAVELLVARIMNRDFGIPSQPRIEMVQREWVDGRSLRAERGQ